ncbi:hypothetical protein NIASO_18510 [Niabella soli DSM 19437]|uniref:Uncharacterized protein n=1 Tax=Niabella soli DSM 19437 TaxID=929713 RepID=W0F855_9BACT|nr:hypothetical protein NIASO_18510 [Niabella soli DSM 19437]
MTNRTTPDNKAIVFFIVLFLKVLYISKFMVKKI